MSDLLPVFEDANAEQRGADPLLMTASQRSKIRELFGELGVSSAARQFEIVAELTGVRITSVGELDAATAHRLVGALQKRIESSGRETKGNAWDDREEETWTDRL